MATKHGYKVPEFTREDVLNVFEVRMLLEPMAARQAAENRTDIGLAEMQRAIDEEKAAHAKGTVPPFLRANVRFPRTGSSVRAIRCCWRCWPALCIRCRLFESAH